MASPLKADESPARCVRRIVNRQIDKALDLLDGRGGLDPEELVHDVRKRLKEIRAMIRMVRSGLGHKVANQETLASGMRGDRCPPPVTPVCSSQAFDDLIGRADSPVDPGAANRIRSALLMRSRSISTRAIEEEACLEATSSALKEARKGLKRWEAAADGWGVLRKGLKRIYRRGHRAFRLAARHPTDEAMPEWRKLVKDLSYTMGVLRPMQPSYAEALEGRAAKLAEALGDDHDLAVLRQALLEPDGVIEHRAAAEAILPLIRRRRSELREAAFSLGHEVFRERTDAFVARLHDFWMAWSRKSRLNDSTEP